MTTELTVLVLAGLLQIAQLMLYAIPANIELGVARTMSPRDEPIDPVQELNLATARLKRAYDNHFEALVLFAIAAVGVTLAGKSTLLTQICAHAYLVARILYVPAYASGAVPWRSVFYGVGLFATAIMLLAALF